MKVKYMGTAISAHPDKVFFNHTFSNEIMKKYKQREELKSWLYAWSIIMFLGFIVTIIFAAVSKQNYLFFSVVAEFVIGIICVSVASDINSIDVLKINLCADELYVDYLQRLMTFYSEKETEEIDSYNKTKGAYEQLVRLKGEVNYETEKLIRKIEQNILTVQGYKKEVDFILRKCVSLSSTDKWERNWAVQDLLHCGSLYVVLNVEEKIITRRNNHE